MKKKIRLFGRMNKNRKEVFKEMLPDKRRPVESTKYLFDELATMASFVPRKNKAVILLSSSYLKITQYDIYPSGKPVIILNYNKRKGGVDTIDEMKQEYTVQRVTRRWTM